MEYRRLGNSGLKVSVIGLGTNRFGSDVLPQKEVNNTLDAALDLGINFLDTANMYAEGESERTIGEALKGKRDRFVIATKFYMKVGEGPNDRGASRYHIQHAVEGSLRRLQTDTIDLYYAHRWDDETPIEETLRAVDDLIQAGKVRYFGASMYASWQLATANRLAEFKSLNRIVALQSEYHLLERAVEKEVLPACVADNVGFIPYFPLAGGFLSGKYKRGQPPPKGSRGEFSPYVQGYLTEENFDRIEAMETWAEARGRTLIELAHAWLMAQPQVSSVISGATKAEHVISNVSAADWALEPQDLEEISTILEPTEDD